MFSPGLKVLAAVCRFGDQATMRRVVLESLAGGASGVREKRDP